jgi:hypothetical protein
MTEDEAMGRLLFFMHVATERLLTLGAYDQVVIARKSDGGWMTIGTENIQATTDTIRQALYSIEVEQAEAEKPAVLS